MAAELQVPKDVAKVIDVKDTSDSLRRFLTDIVNEINELERRIANLEQK